MYRVSKSCILWEVSKSNPNRFDTDPIRQIQKDEIVTIISRGQCESDEMFKVLTQKGEVGFMYSGYLV